MFDSLNRPFPERESQKDSFLTIAWVGLFVSLFLFLIRPFGIEGPWANLVVVCVGFGMVTVLFGWTFDVVIRSVFKIRMHGPKWTLGKWIIMSVALVVWIAIGNFLFINILSQWQAVGFFSLIKMIGYTSLIGVFPVSVSGLMIQMRAAKKNEEVAQDIRGHLISSGNTVEKSICITSANREKLTLNIAHIRYAEAMQNYVSIWFLSEGKLQKELLRTTIANVEKQLAETPVIRCHRSFLVNTEIIDQVSGNAQGLRLKLNGIAEQKIPVSRSYIPKLRQLLG